MNFFYGDKNLLRVLDEAEFWKHQESEHVTVIETIVPGLENQYVSKLNDFQLMFTNTQGEAVKLIEIVVET